MIYNITITGLYIYFFSDPDVPKGIHEENGIKFEYKVYENTNYFK